MNPPAPGRVPLAEILAPEDYQHRLRLSRVDPEAFFAPSPDSSGLLAERHRWLAAHPERHSPFLAEAAPAVAEFADLARRWSDRTSAPDPTPGPSPGPSAQWLALGARLEPDIILLARDAGSPRMIAGSVCFPSSWDPAAKLGLPLSAIHDIVPALNADLGSAIEGFLDRLRPGAAWMRANWGLTASPELNQHPARHLPRLTPPAAPARTLLRIEHQILLALPRTHALVFGIRVEHLPLPDLARRHPDHAAALARALRSMPEPMAVYKGIASVRDSLAAWLASPDSPPFPPGPVESPLTPA